MKAEDFEVGLEIVVKDTDGMDIAFLGSGVLSDATMQMLIEDVAEYLNEEGLT
jgi:transketolase C-terminal domain/subunit